MGNNADGATITVLTAPDDRDVVITDLVMSYHSNCDSRVQIRTNTGAVLGAFRLMQDRWYYGTAQPTKIEHAFNSGLPVPAGESLLLQEFDGCDVAYTMSGYYAQP